MNRTSEKYHFPPEVLDIIVGGKSAIDTESPFQIGSRDEAVRFIRAYGFNLENPIESAEARGNFHEALNFVRKYFLQPENPDGLKIEIPKKILELEDVCDLFLMASYQMPGQRRDTPGSLLRNWACSILKVMHTIAHIDQDLRASYFADVQKQIFDRYYKHVRRDAAEVLYLGEGPDDPLKVELVAFETKPKKGRDSTLLKLLHKPENVAEDIFDRVGIRFITKNRIDALRVVKFLKERMVVMPPNIKPSRSRNTLVDTAAVVALSKELSPQFASGSIDESTFVARLEEAAAGQNHGAKNTHSSEFYRAIQFTARQLIKLRSPLHADLRELKQLVKNAGTAEAITKVVDRIDLKYVPKEVRFFYPYEVQVLDVVSSEENDRGKSAHSEYKRAQVHTALKRVMGVLAQ